MVGVQYTKKEVLRHLIGYAICWVILAADVYFRPEGIEGARYEYTLKTLRVLAPIVGPVLIWSARRHASDCKAKRDKK